MKIRPVGAELCHPDRRTDKQTWRNWTIVFLNFANAPTFFNLWSLIFISKFKKKNQFLLTEKQCVSITKTIRVMLVRDITANLWVRINEKHVNAMYGQSAGFCNVTARATVTFCEVWGFSTSAHICQHDLLLLTTSQLEGYLHHPLQIPDFSPCDLHLFGPLRSFGWPTICNRLRR